MTISWWKRWRGSASVSAAHCTVRPLTECARGSRAAVIRMECANEEAIRLRNLGLYEGSCVTVVDRQGGYLLDVCGSRLALGPKLAGAITVLPLGG